MLKKRSDFFLKTFPGIKSRSLSSSSCIQKEKGGPMNSIDIRNMLRYLADHRSLDPAAARKILYRILEILQILQTGPGRDEMTLDETENDDEML